MDYEDFFFINRSSENPGHYRPINLISAPDNFIETVVKD